MSLDIDKVRSHFPSLASGYIFADNAGGSQVISDVISRISDYLINTNVQLGADYSVGQKSTRRVADGAVTAKELFNASSVDEVAMGASSTLLMDHLTRAMESDVNEGDEFIITGEHESNVGPWKKLAARKGAVIKYWNPKPTLPVNPYSVALAIPDLLPLISFRTRIVAFTACSNILGSIIPVEEVVKAIRERAAKEGTKKLEICVDCVAYAPHRKIDVQKWDVDYCYFSFYKVYGPHVSVLYARAASLHPLTSLVHHFLKVDTLPYKLQPGGPGYEIAYATTAVVPYLLSLSPSNANSLDASFEAIAIHEQQLLKVLLGFLTDPEQVERGVRVVGDEKVGMSRVPTVSFVVTGQRAMKSKDIVKVFDAKDGVGIRYGHFYAYTLIDTLSPKLDVNDGVVRISLVHYNTVDEVERIVDILKEALA
ncbi:hypothetical protein PILCRDRAFT_816514 [Piloderma croceum F 1598]|uniref:Aminotransferase class V domain-containing protein n=1 Tax=Piloderma croceum (strain F 1598) TaxID=765440 RepID=A0A0C3FPD8_PILCF|nr:hypothetical protein PILCRDRAFT_816514 [Piloderma croceum F 1598]